jgi:hypothetical protein
MTEFVNDNVNLERHPELVSGSLKKSVIGTKGEISLFLTDFSSKSQKWQNNLLITTRLDFRPFVKSSYLFC